MDSCYDNAQIAFMADLAAKFTSRRMRRESERTQDLINTERRSRKRRNEWRNGFWVTDLWSGKSQIHGATDQNCHFHTTKNCSACTVYVRDMLCVSNRINTRLSQTQQTQTSYSCHRFPLATSFDNEYHTQADITLTTSVEITEVCSNLWQGWEGRKM